MGTNIQYIVDSVYRQIFAGTSTEHYTLSSNITPPILQHHTRQPLHINFPLPHRAGTRVLVNFLDEPVVQANRLLCVVEPRRSA
jgi:hypothetical protein